MSLTTAAGPISSVQELLRVSLADCIPFRTWGGFADQDEALAAIYHEGLPPPADNNDRHTLAELSAYRPYVVIWTDEQTGFRLRHDADGGPSWHFRGSGLLLARFEQATPEDALNDPAEADRLFRNSLGQIIQSGDPSNPGLVELAGRGGYLAFESIAAQGPFRSQEDEIPHIGDAQAYYLELAWGSP